jgi:hypothetical protein
MSKLQIIAAAVAAALFAGAPAFAQTADTAKAKTKVATTPQDKGDPESPKQDASARKPGPKKAKTKTSTTPQDKGDPEHPQGTMKK